MPLSAPQNLTKTSASITAVALAWDAVAGMDYYDVYRAEADLEGAWGAFAKINDAPVLTEAYTDNAASSTPDPAEGSYYLYFVVAVDGSGQSLPSNPAAGAFVTAAARVDGDMEDDIQDILATDPMADEATYTPYGEAPRTIRGWFDNDNEESEGRRGSKVNNSTPQFACATADVETASNRDTLVLDGITFRVTGVEPDGTGMTVLKLTQDGL